MTDIIKPVDPAAEWDKLAEKIFDRSFAKKDAPEPKTDNPHTKASDDKMGVLKTVNGFSYGGPVKVHYSIVQFPRMQDDYTLTQAERDNIRRYFLNSAVLQDNLMNLPNSDKKEEAITKLMEINIIVQELFK